MTVTNLLAFASSTERVRWTHVGELDKYGHRPKEHQMATPQEMQAAISKAYAAAEKQLLPAKLKVTQENSNAVIAEITRVHGVGSPAIYKSETYYEAFKALYRTLDWAVPPAKLVAER